MGMQNNAASMKMVHSQQQYTSVPISLHSHQHLFFSVFVFILFFFLVVAIPVHLMVSYCGLDLYFPNDQ